MLKIILKTYCEKIFIFVIYYFIKYKFSSDLDCLNIKFDFDILSNFIKHQ